MADNYASEWNKSSEFFYNKGYYSWMSNYIKDYHTVLEIGCGVGYGTLSLVKAGHEVVSVEKDYECISMSNTLINESSFSDKVTFIECDIITGAKINNSFDVVICWNPGIGKVDALPDYIPYMIQYGLTPDQIRADCISSYTEYFVWQISKIAKDAGVPFHLVDRCGASHNPQIELYYNGIKEEIGFSKISIDYLEGETLSEAGVPLQIKGKKLAGNIIPNVLASVLME